MLHRYPHGPRLALGLCGALLLGCQQRDRAPAPATSASADGTARPFELDVVAVRDCEAAPYARLGNDEMLLGVKVKLRAIADEVPQNYYYASLVDSERRRYAPSFTGCDPRLVGDPLAAGAAATGFVNFVLPREARGLSFEYAPRVGNEAKARGTPVARELGR